MTLLHSQTLILWTCLITSNALATINFPVNFAGRRFSHTCPTLIILQFSTANPGGQGEARPSGNARTPAAPGMIPHLLLFFIFTTQIQPPP
jgi:hypothetical protein